MTYDINTITFLAKATGDDLQLTARLDGRVFFDQILTQEETLVKTEFPDIDGEKHLLEIEMSGKLPEHTVIDNQGNIIQDRLIEISGTALDDIALAYLFVQNAQYHHDFNGSRAVTVDKFFGSMGCNGVVKFEFTAPIYLWLLENM
jgi:hypothetical protein